MSELISQELFDEFRSSDWPALFSGLAQKASRKDVEPDQIKSYGALEYHLNIAASGLERTMLLEMELVESYREGNVMATPSMVQDGLIGKPGDERFRFTDFGKEVIMACENLFTPEEHEAANKGKEAELAEIIKAGDAEFGVVR